MFSRAHLFHMNFSAGIGNEKGQRLVFMLPWKRRRASTLEPGPILGDGESEVFEDLQCEGLGMSQIQYS